MLEHRATVLVCTPTYAMHLAEKARSLGIDIAASDIRVTIHAGEPGASLPAVKGQLESAWGARCYDHPGATEVGAWGFECQAQSGVHLNEREFLFEVLDPETGAPADEGELVVTNLGRWGMPVIRYRTGDRVRRSASPCPCGCGFGKLEGGVIGRLDDAFIVRGVNIYPSAVENVIRQVEPLGEFAVGVYRRRSMDEIEIRLEAHSDDPHETARLVGDKIRSVLSLRADVRAVARGTLPRFELKARRFVDHRTAGERD